MKQCAALLKHAHKQPNIEPRLVHKSNCANVSITNQPLHNQFNELRSTSANTRTFSECRSHWATLTYLSANAVVREHWFNVDDTSIVAKHEPKQPEYPKINTRTGYVLNASQIR